MLNIKKFIRKVIYGFMKCMPVKKDEVLLMSYYGAQYSGSPKYISLYLENHSDMNIVWAFTDTVSHSDYNGKSVRFGGVKYYYHLAVAGAIVTNYRMTDEFRKRRGQIYIQTWHSSLRLKMIEKDAGETLKKSYIAMAQNDSKQISYLLAGSKKGHDIFQNAFGMTAKYAMSARRSVMFCLRTEKNTMI